MSNYIRNIPGYGAQDPASIDAVQYNQAAGSKKVSEVGRHLLPIPVSAAGATTYTTDASTIRALGFQGLCLAVYNKDTSVHAVTLGEAAGQAALAAGVTDATGHVGIPCAPGAWTYIACGLQNFVITDSALLCVFLVDDNSTIKAQ